MCEAVKNPVEKVTKWVCPEGTGIPLITMPNVPRPLHGTGMQPRTIYGETVWNYMRKKAYFDADYKCEICGCSPEKGQLHAHELFDYDYENTTGTFNRVVAICRTCHDGIHSGRLITMYKNNNPLYPASYVLKVVENAFRLVHDFNVSHPDAKLKLYETFVGYLQYPELEDKMKYLIKKYGIEFYGEHVVKSKRWKGWKVIVNGKEYESPYKCQADWEDAMAINNKQDEIRNLENPFSGGVFDEIDKILNS